MYFHFTKPFDTLRRLEKFIVELRSHQCTLVLFYSEELRHRLIDMVVTTERLRARSKDDLSPRLKVGDKDIVKKAIKILLADEAITKTEAGELRKLIDLRNDVAHRVDHLFSDLEPNDADLKSSPELQRRFPTATLDPNALDKFNYAFEILSRARRLHFNVSTYRRRGWLFFSSSERVLLKRVKSIEKQLPKLIEQRNTLIDHLNSQLPQAFKLVESHGFAQFNLRYPLGKMTPRGEEICYRLFDAEIHELVIAQIFKMKLRAISARKKKWIKMGASRRPSIDFESLPDLNIPSEF